jgi:proline iminopeptidase
MMETTTSIFPEIEPYRTGRLQVSDLHTLYYEEVGNPHGQPVVFLHGGPGGGISPLARRFYDPAFYRIILFDQRGSGLSTPHAELRENTTWDLVADIERVREQMGVERWLVFGGSWGSSLSLAYAIRHPDRVIGLILRGIFLCRKVEIDWLYQNGASFVFPDGWDQFIEPIPPAERGNMLAAYYRRLTDPDPAVQQAAAWPWSRWETQCSRHIPDPEALARDDDPEKTLAISRIEAHYFVNESFFPEDDYLLKKAAGLSAIPTRIVQGRYDMVCPIRSAWDLLKVMPHADLRIVPDGGHSVKDPSIAAGLVQATEDFKALF